MTKKEKKITVVECWENSNRTAYQAIQYPMDHPVKHDPQCDILVYRYYFDDKHNVIDKEIKDNE